MLPVLILSFQKLNVFIDCCSAQITNSCQFADVELSALVSGIMTEESRRKIWKQWKVPSARIRNLIRLGIPKYYACKWGDVKAYWRVAGSPVRTRAITNERLAQAGFYSLSDRYESLTYAIEPPCTEPYARWCERSARYLASYSISLCRALM